MLALGMMLAALGKQADLYSADPVPQIYRGLPCAAAIRQAARVEGEYDAAILLECDGVARTRLEGLEGRLLVNIDHHASWKAFAEVNWIEEGACAVAEMVYRLTAGGRHRRDAADGHLPVYSRAHGYGIVLLRRHGRACV